MTCYASGHGKLTPVSGNIPSKILSELDQMGAFELYPLSDEPWDIVYDCSEFDSDLVGDYLCKVAPYVKSAYIEMSGDDGTHWKYICHDGVWRDVSAHIVYDDEPMLHSEINSSNESRLEFVHDIIDVFENFLDDKGIIIENPEKEESGDSAANIYGTDYGDLESELECILQRWHVLK